MGVSHFLTWIHRVSYKSLFLPEFLSESQFRELHMYNPLIQRIYSGASGNEEEEDYYSFVFLNFWGENTHSYHDNINLFRNQTPFPSWLSTKISWIRHLVPWGIIISQFLVILFTATTSSPQKAWLGQWRRIPLCFTDSRRISNHWSHITLFLRIISRALL